MNTCRFVLLCKSYGFRGLGNLAGPLRQHLSAFWRMSRATGKLSGGPWRGESIRASMLMSVCCPLLVHSPCQGVGTYTLCKLRCPSPYRMSLHQQPLYYPSKPMNAIEKHQTEHQRRGVGRMRKAACNPAWTAAVARLEPATGSPAGRHCICSSTKILAALRQARLTRRTGRNTSVGGSGALGRTDKQTDKQTNRQTDRPHI